MIIDFDKLRLDGAKHFNTLVDTLNKNMVDYGDDMKYIVSFASEIEDSMRGLRNFIAALLSIEDKKPGPINTVWTQLKCFDEEDK